ncbi:MAG: efflux RND transporter periplasmic adaptor subunit [Bacteroidaceae bacterium]|nr:efflux RND transporter periplasmic adaptor subunit [Bacteroidaceae bacterium]
MKKLMFAVALLVITACHKKAEPTEESAALPIEVSTPIVREITLTREYPGYLKADATIPVVGRVNGSIIKRNFTEGSRVKKGDLLFVIEPTLYENAVTQAQASLQTAIAEQEYARSNYERMQAAISSNAVSEIEVLQAKSRVESSNAAVSNAKAALKTAQTKLGYCYIEAPSSGSVSLAKQPTGAYIAGEMSPVELCHLYKDDLMYAFFNIPDIQWFRKALATSEGIDQSNITFTLGEGNIIKRNATIDYLSPNVNTGTGTLQIRAELPNSDGVLKSGSYISIIMPYEKVNNALLIKDASIGTDQTGKFIYVIDAQNKVEYRRIEVGDIIDDTLRLVTGGLEANERYVTKALLKVRNGMSIVPIME